MKKFHHGKTKVVFTLGIYVLFWRHKIRVWLRDDFGLAIDPKREFWLTFVPFVNMIHWWNLLEEIKGAQKRAGMTEHLHVAHAFFLSAFWFASVPYVDKHLNALAEVRAGMGHHKHGEFQPANEWAKS